MTAAYLRVTQEIGLRTGQWEQRARTSMERRRKRGGVDVAAAIGGAGRNAMLTGSGKQTQQMGNAYGMFRQWVFVAVNAIAVRLSGQPWMAGELEDAPENPDREERRRAGRIKMVQPWLADRAPRFLAHKAVSEEQLNVLQTHPVLDALEHPNPLQRKAEFLYLSAVSLKLTGVCYWVGGLVKDKEAEGGERLEIWCVPSNYIEPDHSDGLFSAYKLKMPGEAGEGTPLPAENVARTYYPDPTDLKAVYPPLAACWSAAKTDEYIQASQQQLFERPFMPKVALIVGKDDATGRRPTLAGPQRRGLIRAIREVWDQTTRFGDPAILDGLIEDVKKLDPSVREMDWMNSGKIVKDRIFQTYGVNPIVVGEVPPSSKAQAAVAEMSFCSQVINPLADSFSQTATTWLGPMYETPQRLVIWIEPAIPDDDDAKASKWGTALGQKAVGVDEYRAEVLGLPPVEPDEPEPVIRTDPNKAALVAQVLPQVNQGAVQREQAVELFVELGVDRERAEAIIGEPPPEPPAGAPAGPGGAAVPGAVPGAEAEPAEPENPWEPVDGQEWWERPKKHLQGGHDQQTHAGDEGGEQAGGTGVQDGDSKEEAKQGPKIGDEWKNAVPKMASELSGVTPVTKVRTITAYHVTKRENAEKILKTGFDLSKVKHRWMNDHAVSLSKNAKSAVEYFANRGQQMSDRYVLLEVKIKGRYTTADNPIENAYDAYDYTKKMIKSGHDGQDLGKHLYVHNPKSILSIKVAPIPEHRGKSFFQSMLGGRDEYGEWQTVPRLPDDATLNEPFEIVKGRHQFGVYTEGPDRQLVLVEFDGPQPEPEPVQVKAAPTLDEQLKSVAAEFDLSPSELATVRARWEAEQSREPTLSEMYEAKLIQEQLIQEKHLQGQHDQTVHGHRYDTNTETGERTRRERKPGAAKPSKKPPKQSEGGEPKQGEPPKEQAKPGAEPASEKPKEEAKPKEPVKQEHKEGVTPKVPDAERKAILDRVLNDDFGSKLSVNKKSIAQFEKDGDIEAFVKSLEGENTRDSWCAGSRAEHAYAEKYGGINVAKSEALISVRDKSFATANSMDQEERDAIQEYTTNSFVDVNEALRAGKKLPEGGKEMVAAVNKIVDEVGEWEKPATVFRGINTDDEKQLAQLVAKAEKHIKEGTNWTEKGITSTSASQDMATNWIHKAAGGGILMRIKANKGALISQFTGLSNQEEIVQKPGSQFKPIKIGKMKTKFGREVTVIDFEQV